MGGGRTQDPEEERESGKTKHKQRRMPSIDQVRLETVAVGNKGGSKAWGEKMSEDGDSRDGRRITPPLGPWHSARLLAPATVPKEYNILARPGSWETCQVPVL